MVTMVRANLWPSSPKRPHLAFTFELLDWIEALFLECQVALKDFCQALLFKAISPFEKVTGHLVRFNECKFIIENKYILSPN